MKNKTLKRTMNTIKVVGYISAFFGGFTLGRSIKLSIFFFVIMIICLGFFIKNRDFVEKKIGEKLW